MNSHSKAKLTPLSRAEMINRILDLSQPVAKVAADFGLFERCAYKWLARFRAEGFAGLYDRSSRPTCSPRTSHPLRVARVLALRRRKLPGFQIARAARLSPRFGFALSPPPRQNARCSATAAAPLPL